jgi:hypothetical protein
MPCLGIFGSLLLTATCKLSSLPSPITLYLHTQMSEAAKASPACFTCRKTCRRCDRARPACQRCLDKGLQCGGYPDKFRFCGPASRGKLKHLTGSNIEPPASSQSSVSTRRKTVRRTSRRQAPRTPSSPISASSPSLEIVLLESRVEVLLAYCEYAGNRIEILLSNPGCR